MIWACDEPPMIALGEAGLVAFEHAWLVQCLEEAAEAAGYVEWPVACDVAQSVTDFLMTQSSERPFSLESFTTAVHRALCGVGYDEVAPHFLRDGIELRISLLDFARQVPCGFQLGFFKACERACVQLMESGMTHRVSFEQLRPAVKAVLGRVQWGAKCDELAAELVDFLRAFFSRRTVGPSVSLLIR